MRKPSITAAVLSLLAAGALAQSEVGPLTVTEPWARATAPAQRVGAAYLTIANRGAAGDRLVAAASPVAETVELHTHAIDAQGIARMRAIEAIAIEPGAEIALAPGGLHVMLIGLRHPLAAGATFPLTLTFAEAGQVTLDVAVRPIAGRAGGSHGAH
jgi:hypothetical protein